MKKIILLILMTSIHLFGWSLIKPSETVKLNGYDLEIINIDEKNEFKIFDSFQKTRNTSNFKGEMTQRITDVFKLINEYGMKKGYKSYVISNTGLNLGEIGINSGGDIAKYCLLNTTDDKEKRYTGYGEYCHSGSNPLINGDYNQFLIIDVVYFKDDTGNFSTSASY